jgi:hypothetical protein
MVPSPNVGEGRPPHVDPHHSDRPERDRERLVAGGGSDGQAIGANADDDSRGDKAARSRRGVRGPLIHSGGARTGRVEVGHRGGCCSYDSGGHHGPDGNHEE